MKWVLFIASVIGLAGTTGAQTLVGHEGTPNSAPPLRAEDLFQGDLTAEIGIGCSGLPGTSGGPNDVAVGVTADRTPPFPLCCHYYYIFTQVSPTITALSFVAWEGGAAPGAEIPGSRVPGMDWTEGGHTAYVGDVMITTAQFYFGQNQPQTNVGMRWGVDTSSGSAGTSFIRAPTCGAEVFVLLDDIGFPGNWVMAVAIYGGETPVELATWGSVKASYR